MDRRQRSLVLLEPAMAAKLLLQLQVKLGAPPAIALCIVHHLLQLELGVGDGSKGDFDLMPEDNLLAIEFIDKVRELAAEMSKVSKGVIPSLLASVREG